MSKVIRVVIADDQELIRHGLRELIEFETDIRVIGEAGDGAEALTQTLHLKPDVLLLDLSMPGVSGLDVLADLNRLRPQPRVLVLTGMSDDDTVVRALQCGANGFLPKTASPDDLVQAIRSVSGEGMPIHPQVAGVVVRRLNQPPAKPMPQPRLTAREYDVLYMLARGHTNSEIARSLVISQYTVRSHICNLLKKLHLSNRTQAALYVLKHGMAQH